MGSISYENFLFTNGRLHGMIKTVKELVETVMTNTLFAVSYFTYYFGFAFFMGKAYSSMSANREAPAGV